jgi:hypothetical protein
MKIALDFQSGERMTAFTMLVTHACPRQIGAGGCSLFCQLGTIHETLGSVPARASRKKSSDGCTFIVWWSVWTSRKCGSGFQMLGVWEFWARDGQCMSPSAQSGCTPGSTK